MERERSNDLRIGMNTSSDASPAPRVHSLSTASPSSPITSSKLSTSPPSPETLIPPTFFLKTWTKLPFPSPSTIATPSSFPSISSTSSFSFSSLSSFSFSSFNFSNLSSFLTPLYPPYSPPSPPTAPPPYPAHPPLCNNTTN